MIAVALAVWLVGFALTVRLQGPRRRADIVAAAVWPLFLAALAALLAVEAVRWWRRSPW